MKKAATAFIVVLAAVAVLAAGPAPRDILEKTVDRSGVFRDTCMSIRIIKTKKSGRTKTIDLTIFQKRYPEMTNTLVRVESPDEARGISFLTWDYKDPGKPDDKFYYLPALKQYQQLSGDKGADYEERFGFSQDLFAIDLDAAEHTLLEDEVVNGAPCYKVESVMKDPDNPQGARAVTWVRKDNSLAAKVQAFDRQDQMIKDFVLLDMEKFGEMWHETHGIYKDLVKGQTIEFMITKPRFNTGLPDEIFLKSFNPEEAEAP